MVAEGGGFPGRDREDGRRVLAQPGTALPWYPPADAAALGIDLDSQPEYAATKSVR